MYNSTGLGHVGCELAVKRKYNRDDSHPKLLEGLFNYLSNGLKGNKYEGKLLQDATDNKNYNYCSSYIHDITADSPDADQIVNEIISRFNSLMVDRGLST